MSEEEKWTWDRQSEIPVDKVQAATEHLTDEDAEFFKANIQAQDTPK